MLLASEKAFTESIIEAAQAILLILDCNGKIVRFNRYMENLSGYSLEEARGKDWFETFLPGRDRDRIKELFLKSVGGSKAHGFVNPIVARNGREILIEWNDHPLKDNRGNLIGLVSVGQDVTERTRDEAIIQDHRVHLALINRILRHDVSNDLGVIKSALRLFLSSKEERFLLEASERVDKSVSLIQDMKRYENIITAGSELKSLRLAPATEYYRLEAGRFKRRLKARLWVFNLELLI
ncbi:MAG: PAS domain S-box protein, partial [Deltaproteobacteria bacterium]|nr:PAS domain S-box protein [Deltaproteobacteria bacterium]